MKFTEQIVRNIIKKLIKSTDYRAEVINLINAEFLQFTIDFFKKVIETKLNSKSVTIDWYKEKFLLDPQLSPQDIAIHSGLNMKTIQNMFNSGEKTVVIDASKDHYDTLCESIEKLVDKDGELDLKLTIKLNDVSIDLNINETLIVINALAVKRAALRGGLWSTAGKRVEKPLMKVLCELYGVPDDNYRAKNVNSIRSKGFKREVDFYLVDQKRKEYKCEVKLMGKGNPESADVVIARDSRIFVADKLSNTNKKQLQSRKIEWLALRDKDGYKKFGEILKKLHIPFKEKKVKNLDHFINKVLK